MDFYSLRVRDAVKKGEPPEVYPDWKVGRSKDLMVRGKSFYAIWDEEKGVWSTDEYDVQRLVDADIKQYSEKLTAETGIEHTPKYLRSFSSNGWNQFRKYMANISDNSHELDDNLTFANSEVKKSDYVSKRLPYSLEDGDYSAWDELVGTLYNVEEREKIEWMFGAIVSGDSKKIQKFLVLYGPAGTGKSTVLNIAEDLFVGYTTTFDAKALGKDGGGFATEAFKGNPLVAIQHDGDLSRIEDNTKLNSIVSHEWMPMNEKYKPSYTSRVNACLLMGTNQPVKISDAKSGIIRRLIDVHPTGVIISKNHYVALMSRIEFELGAIAKHCLDVYRNLGQNHFNTYRPLEMMLQTDIFFNFIEAHFDLFKEQNGTTLKQAYSLYKEFCSDTGIERVLPQYKFREELRNYFDTFAERVVVNDVPVRSYYEGFNANKFKAPTKDVNAFSLVMDETHSIFDDEFRACSAQGATEAETPKRKWEYVTSVLEDLDTSEIHFVKVPENLIVIDFDIRGEDGEKSLEKNLAAASVWPATYAELSKSGSGVHLHYWYDGDVSVLAPIYSEGIEVKVFSGGSSLRRRVTRCNAVPFATLSSGLPIKEKKVLTAKTIQSEKGLRDLIARALSKEFGRTKPSVDFIKKILDEHYESGQEYDVSDLRGTLLAFANNSSNQPLPSLKIVQSMKFKSDEKAERFIGPDDLEAHDLGAQGKDDRIVFYDVEVYPNLFVICWKFEGDASMVKMINPSAQDVEKLFQYKLVGFYNRRYDNHILYAAYMGYSVEQLYKLSQKIVNDDRSGFFGEAYSLSYADIWDFSSLKQPLKKFEIDLGLTHMEMDLPWDEPVKPEDVDRIVKYCCNDVEATEATFNARRADFVARQILAELSGLSVNDTTQKHTARIIFGNDRNPQKEFIYTDLSEEFEGYKFDMGKSDYNGEDPGEGGYVYAEPGMYENVAVLDIASMHPTTIIHLNLFGKYTPKFADLYWARLAIKHGDYNAARNMLDGRLKPYLQDEKQAKQLAYALKIVINIVYGLTSAKFDNPFRDPKNVDNIVAKRGALFMIDLKVACQEMGLQVVHIKTDSIKIPNATPEIINMITEFGAKYGYDFEHEATYDKFCLVNNAVYIAREGDHWQAVGAEFQHPYVYKSLFTHEEITFDDLCETKSVQKGAMYLDFDMDERPSAEPGENMQFVGKIGRFVPVAEDMRGGILYVVRDDTKSAVSGTKGYFWIEATMAKQRGIEDGEQIDMNYFEELSNKAVKQINKFGNFDEFVK